VELVRKLQWRRKGPLRYAVSHSHKSPVWVMRMRIWLAEGRGWLDQASWYVGRSRPEQGGDERATQSLLGSAGASPSQFPDGIDELAVARWGERLGDWRRVAEFARVGFRPRWRGRIGNGERSADGIWPTITQGCPPRRTTLGYDV